MEKPAQQYPIKVALIYGYKPSGHYSAARALAEFFPESIIEPVFINLSDVYPNLGPFVAKTYLEILQKTPALWDYLYDNEMIAKATHSLKTALIPYYAEELAGLLIKKNVKAIISTHALPCILLSKREKELKNIPMFGVITDFYAHSYWPGNGVTRYFVPERTAQSGLEENGIDPARITVSGIPVRKEFLQTGPAQKKRKELGLAPNLFTLLVSGGSRGLGNIIMSVETLKPFLGKLQLIVLCGENKKLRHKLEKSFKDKKHVKILNFVHSTANYYAAADLIIGKPGGVTIAETTALVKPMLIFSPLPGQEERNANFLVKNKIAEFVKDRRHLETTVRKYLHNPNLLSGLGKNISNYARPYASRDIVSKIMECVIGT